jgi:cardiolipin synthase
MQYKKSVSASGYSSVNRVKLIRGGKPYFDLLLQMIAGAKESIHLQTYIYDDDETGIAVAEALKEATLRNVKVYLMADGYASQVMSQSFINKMRAAGIHFRFFEPLFKSKFFYFGRRLHHKMAVVDTRYALVGGINITNRYNDMPGKPAWLDYALYTEGETARELCVLCWKTWKGFPVNMGITPCEEKQLSFEIPAAERSDVRMRRNDWVRRKNQISKTYLEMLRNSSSQVTILCSYFIPGHVIRRNMVQAVNRGVRVRVIAAGPSDVMLAKHAERWLYDWLLRKGIELYEYRKNILHGKIAVADDEWMTIGSYNINDISAYASIELNLDVRNPDFAKEVKHELEEIIANDCILISPEQHSSTKNIFVQFIRWFSYHFITVAFNLITFYFKQRT